MADGEDLLDRRERLRARRRERLLALLPRIYAAQPEGSVVAVLLDALAGRLAELDEATERVLRDRWVALAGSGTPWDDGPHPIDRLAALMNVSRAVIAVDDATQAPILEEDEAFRRRLRQTAPVLVRSSTTVRSLLTVATAAMDAELCHRLTRLPEGRPERQDTTLGYGVRPGTVALCPGCRTGGTRCIYEDAPSTKNPITARVLLTDNPPTPRRLRVAPVVQDATFVVRNLSLVSDRPVVTLEATTQTIDFPALENVAGREVMLYAGKLLPGQKLVVTPRRTDSDALPFDGYDPQGPALQWRMAPDGGAFVLDGDTRTAVPGKILFLHAEVFDEARFAPTETSPTASRFALLGRAMVTPRIDVGESTWKYRGYTKTDITALADPTLKDVLDAAPTQPSAGTVAVSLEWWMRPPAALRVSVKDMPSRPRNEIPGVRELLERTVTAVRAAGVHVSVDFPEPPRQEAHALGEQSFTGGVKAAFGERQPASEALKVHPTTTHAEQQPQQETGFSIKGIFDVTRLDWSTLQE